MKLVPIFFVAVFSMVFTTTSQDKALEDSMIRGAEIYQDFCVNCHMPTGLGVPSAFPPLAKSDYLMKKRAESIKAIKYGIEGEITVNGKKYKSAMVPLGLEDDEIADVMNYISNSWGNKSGKIVTEAEVSASKK